MHRVELWIFTTLFSVGVIIGMTYLDMQETTEPTENAVAATQQSINVPTPEKEQSSTALELSDASIEHNAQLLTLGDRYMVAGNYALALEKFRLYGKHAKGERASILLRQAFCHEQQNQFLSAEKVYRDAQTASPIQNYQILASVGHSRCLLRRGKYRFALEQVADQILKLDGETIAPDTRAQLVFHFAKVLEAQAIFEQDNFNRFNSKSTDATQSPSSAPFNDPKDLIQPNSVVFDQYDPNPETLLAALKTPSSQPQRDRPSELSIEIQQRSGDSAVLIALSVFSGIQPTDVLLQQLSQTADVQLQISPQARKRLAGRARSIHLKTITLASLLDQLLTPENLAWFQTESEILIITKSEMQVSQASVGYWFELAQRSLRKFEIEYSENDRRSASLFARANLSLLSGDLDYAANLYQELEQMQTTGEMQAKMFFNQAKLNMRRQRVDEANRLFYLAIDQTLDPNVESSSYCLIAENLLAKTDLEGSLTTGRRAVSLATTYRQKQVATLNLARAYLLKNDPFSANLILFKNREFFEQSPLKPIASVLGTYARFMGVSDEDGIRIARNRLLTSISMLDAAQSLTSPDCYVIAMAYEQLGFGDRAIAAMKQAIEKTQVVHWQRKLTYELAVVHYKRKNFDASIPLLQQLADVEDDWKRKSLLQLATIYNDQSMTEACITICKQVWKEELTLGQRDFVLKLLGKSYQTKGEHHTAALCFAGMLPDRF